MAKLNTRKKGIFSVDEMRAYRAAYGRKLGARDAFFFIGLPGLLYAAFSFLVLYNGWVSGVLAILGSLYGWRSLMPRAIRKQYEASAFKERNRFLNNVTQVLTDPGQTVIMAIKKVTSRSEGEFRRDLQKFNAMLMGADNIRIRNAVVWFSDRYDDDVIFTQYLEQLETAMLEGKTNVDTLKDIKTYHNQISEKQIDYEKKKNGHLMDMKVLAMVIGILIVAMATSFGFDTYLRAFARSIVGYISGGIYFFVMTMFARKFVNYLFDDSVMEIRK